MNPACGAWCPCTCSDCSKSIVHLYLHKTTMALWGMRVKAGMNRTCPNESQWTTTMINTSMAGKSAAFPLKLHQDFQPWGEAVSDPIEGRLQMLQIHQTETGQENGQMDRKDSAGLGIEWQFHSIWNTNFCQNSRHLDLDTYIYQHNVDGRTAAWINRIYYGVHRAIYRALNIPGGVGYFSHQQYVVCDFSTSTSSS